MGDERDRPSPTATITGTGAPTASPTAPMERGATFGRYLVLEQIGAGGMGVVYTAYDPDLDRRVAVKVLRPEVLRDQTRLRREAQAIARLQHPNVIAVYDVGSSDDCAFVAMELVDGKTLAHWLADRPRSWSEVVDVFIQAGCGLAAAHAVGLVHRDFKPGNALIGRDGRVRVVDFGLARAIDASADGAIDRASSASEQGSAILRDTITRTGALLGTPTYMSPEQFRSAATDAKSDQFSFSVSLYRALYGEPPFAGDDLATLCEEVTSGRVRPPPKETRVPSWLRDVALRGLATDPAQRWPSMDALLAALARDPMRVRRQWMLGAGAAAALVLLGLGYRGLQRHESLVCRGADRKLAGVWDDARKNAVRASFAATGKSNAESAFGSVVHALDAYSSGWVALHTEACEATRLRREQSEELLDLRMECLGQRLQEANAQIDLFTHADTKIVDRAAQMTSSLSPLAGCSDVAALRAPVRPPDPATGARVEELRKKVAQVKALKLAGKIKEGLAIAVPTAAEVRALKYRPLEGEALVWLGTLQDSSGDFKAATAALEDAAFAARAGNSALWEANASSIMMFVAVNQGRPEIAHLWASRGFAALEALPSGDERLRARLLQGRGTTYGSEGRYAEALEDHRTALAMGERLYGPNSTRVAQSVQTVGQLLINLGQYRDAEPYIHRALAIYAKELAPDAESAVFATEDLGTVLAGQGRNDEAVPLYRHCVATQEKLYGPEYAFLTGPLVELADAIRQQGKYDEAMALDRRALTIGEKTRPDHPDVALALRGIGEVLRIRGKYDEALGYYRRAAAIGEKAAGVPLARALTGIGRAELGRHDGARAIPPLEQALQIRERHAGDAAELAETRFALARALWDGGRDPERARRLATQARAGFAADGERSKRELSEVDAWMSRHR